MSIKEILKESPSEEVLLNTKKITIQYGMILNGTVFFSYLIKKENGMWVRSTTYTHKGSCLNEVIGNHLNHQF